MKTEKFKNIIVCCTAAVAFTLGAAMVHAGAPQGDITIDGKKPVPFSHSKHTGLGISCGECHHDAQHNPLAESEITGKDKSELQCTSCHNKSFANDKLQKPKDIFHANCKECHKQGFEGKKGPTKCSDCHTKKRRAIEGC